jgi:hypothetical protein
MLITLPFVPRFWWSCKNSKRQYDSSSFFSLCCKTLYDSFHVNLLVATKCSTYHSKWEQQDIYVSLLQLKVMMVQRKNPNLANKLVGWSNGLCEKKKVFLQAIAINPKLMYLIPMMMLVTTSTWSLVTSPKNILKKIQGWPTLS